MHLLGISAFYHDSAACLLRDGKIVAAAQEERFTRKKHDEAFPENAISFCLDAAGIEESEIDLVSFYEKPFLKFERILETYLAFAPRGINSFLKAMPLWIKKKLWTRDLIKEGLDYKGLVIFPEHHESHAASAFYPSPFQEAAFLTIDGVGEWSTSSFGTGNGNEIQLMADLHFPHSLGLLYSAFTSYTGFRVNSGEYKMMGLAPYGESKYKKLIYDHLIDLKEDGSFRMNMEYFNFCAGLTMTSSRFHELFGGPPRKPDGSLTQRDMDLARSIQEVAEDVVLKMARNVRKETGMKRLCLAGGVALNCVANGHLSRAGVFDEVWVQPASGDAGGALGCALLAWHGYLGNAREVSEGKDSMRGSFLGPEFEDGVIKEFIDEKKLHHVELGDDELADTVADLIADGKVVGWFQGPMEFGPRALGARSILGDARSSEMQSKMNLKIKYRESFRPFAPSVRIEDLSEWFEIEHASPYMVFVADVSGERRQDAGKEEASVTGLERLKSIRSDVPAVTHVDCSARIQSVDAENNPRFHRLLSRFNEKHGCPVMVNTSFNVRGEPMVCTPKDAYLCFMRTQMDYLLLGNYLLDKKELSKVSEIVEWDV